VVRFSAIRRFSRCVRDAFKHDERGEKNDVCGIVKTFPRAPGIGATPQNAAEKKLHFPAILELLRHS
jgi:hypothetical protein